MRIEKALRRICLEHACRSDRFIEQEDIGQDFDFRVSSNFRTVCKREFKLGNADHGY